MKSLGVLLALSLVSVCCSGEEFAIFRGPCHTHQGLTTDLGPDSYEIGYVDELGAFYLSTGDPARAAWIDLSSDDLAQLRGILNKYFRSEKAASGQGREINQELSKITTSVHWTEDDTRHEADGLDLLFGIVSMPGGTYLLKIWADTVFASDHSAESYHLDGLLLYKSEVQLLAEGISKKNIDRAISEREKSSSR
jgi:hypothetical protein